MLELGAVINMRIIMPELALLASAFIMLVLAPLTRKRAVSPILAILAILVSSYFVARAWGHQESGYFGMVICDNFCLFCKVIFLFVCATSILVSREYLNRHGVNRPEYYALMLISTVGMMVMVSSANLITIFLGLEIMSLPLYVLAGFLHGNLRSTEASVKYFFMGAFASAFLLYGIALVYGATGTTDLEKIFMSSGVAMQKNQLYLIIGAAMILIGFAFKVASFPFHMWVPDVYEGAPTPVTAFFSIGPKAAGIAALLRIFMVGFGDVFQEFAPLFWLLAFFTMTVGNILAIMQDDIKRMLAYSSIAHAGYLLVAVTAGGAQAVSSALYYLLAYGFFNMGAFALVIIIENRNGGSNKIDTYRGLAMRHPWLSVFLALFMFSLAGFPPTAGFFAKFYVFSAAVNAGMVWLVVVAVLNSLISVYYYLRPVKAAFFDREDVMEHPRLVTGPLVIITLLITVSGTLILGILPNYFLKLATSSVFMMM